MGAAPHPALRATFPRPGEGFCSPAHFAPEPETFSPLPKGGGFALLTERCQKAPPFGGAGIEQSEMTERVHPPKELPPFLYFMALSVKFLKICAGSFANPGGFMLYLS